ncbi:unnamed protein product [Hermetia illucens]|uniref:Phosphatidylinositol 3,4,5-trisphosphate 3-phosphatase and dual-specificity protein phosphatase PTEN n=1 Tax=Hermetia illucens TaxID=343691 RepID=A0A7R8UEB8_HERIL|nr:phosphatidylinositol 3,4,5-trisphosphate 3-phosphatase cnrN isoform X1 [Hermetia illucens]XP_037904352.1 phosphatidylinositol 3,4,5-trisphosphate 3-phosphatase cnrN isoform X1 [Hermetia illucens]XP_037904362.1 phosphatidylinositol 3,4,5-trisphosphate 3-phosphatase cnrN isoform X1 [Hermetia illucens]CAD7079133.1 unnamed protein product [Hermetia illucens]
MANTISVMTNAVRGVVSKKRIRYQENGYDLDLAYVSDRLIAMGYPAENIESIFRNKIEHVYHFLEEKHKDHYKIYNLCSERHYDGNRFHGRVALYPFDDHNPPPVTLIKEFCDDVDAWLKADKDNVAAVHCKAGKGRTGTMICCYLLHCHMKTTAESALTYYDEKRTKNKKGVTIPSQRRYVEYYAKLVNSGQPYEERTLQICEIRFFPQLSNQDNIHCSIYPHPRSDDAESTNITLNFRKTQIIEINDRCIPLTGDVKIEVYRKVMKRKERYFHFWFNTFFIGDKAAAYEDDGSEKKFVYELSKHELDDAHKDTEHKTVPQDFKVQLLFKTVQKDHHTTMPSITPAIASVRNDANSHVRSHYKVPFSQQNHHPHYNQTQLSNNIGMNHTNSNLVICKSALSPVNNINATTTTANKLTSNSTRLSSMGSSSSGSSIGDQQQSTGTFSMRNSSVNPLKKDLKLQNHTKDCNDVMELQPSYPDHGIELGVNEQPMLDLFMNGSGRDTSSAIAAGETHTPSVRFEVSRTNSSSRSSSINSSEVSPQSEVGGDEDEGWDSGELHYSTKLKEHVSDVKVKNENGRKNSMSMAMMDADDCNSTLNVNNKHSLVSSSSLHLPQDSSGTDNISLHYHDFFVRNDKSRNLKVNNLKEYSINNNISCNNNNSNNDTSSRHTDIDVDENTIASCLTEATSSGSYSNSSNLVSIGNEPLLKLCCDATLASSSCTGCSKSANTANKPSKSSNKSLGLHTTISNNNNSMKKVQQTRRWLSSMKSDPNLCDTLAKSVHFRDRSSLASNCVGWAISKPAIRQTIINGDSEDSYSCRSLNYSPSTHRTRTNSTSDHDDYYSSLCDTQLSYGGSSPMKSPQTNKEKSKLLGSSTIQENRRENIHGGNLPKSDVVVAKPIQSSAIGFKVSSNAAHQNVGEVAGPDFVDRAKSDQQQRENKSSDGKDFEWSIETDTGNFKVPATQLSRTTVSNEDSKMDPKIESNGVAAPPRNAIALLPEERKSLVLISSSPPACKSNSCGPFTFQKFRQELISILGKNKSSSSSNKTDRAPTNSVLINRSGKSKKSLPPQSPSSNAQMPLTVDKTSTNICANSLNATIRDRTTTNDNKNPCDDDMVDDSESKDKFVEPK